jgi:hypothetical protein
MSGRGKGLRNLADETYGLWTVLPEYRIKVWPSGWRETQWLARCSCGTERFVRSSHLTSGKSTNCGCLQHIAASLRLARQNKERQSA